MTKKTSVIIQQKITATENKWLPLSVKAEFSKDSKNSSKSPECQ